MEFMEGPSVWKGDVICERGTPWSEDKSFDRYVAIPAASIHYGTVGTGVNVMVWDASHLKTLFGGVLFLITELDANNHVTILGHAVCAAEDARNASWVLSHVRRAFPTAGLLLSDMSNALL